MERKSPTIDQNRRRFISMAAGTLAAAQFGLVHSASGQSEPPEGATTETAALFPGFSAESVKTSGTTIYVLRKGTGRPLLLLHGYPETHLTWHKVAPRLAEQFSVRPAILDGDVFAFDEPCVIQALPKGIDNICEAGSRGASEKADHRHRRLLRLRRERPPDRAAEQRDELAPTAVDCPPVGGHAHAMERRYHASRPGGLEVYDEFVPCTGWSAG